MRRPSMKVRIVANQFHTNSHKLGVDIYDAMRYNTGCNALRYKCKSKQPGQRCRRQAEM